MRNIFTIEAITETATHKELVSKKENFKIELLEKRIARERITNAFHVYKNKGVIPTTVKGTEFAITNDLINLSEIDRSISMNCEEIHLKDE